MTVTAGRHYRRGGVIWPEGAPERIWADAVMLMPYPDFIVLPDAVGFFSSGRDYTVYAQVMDAWTPAGMLRIHLSDAVTVQDNLFSDWHVRPLN